MAEAASADTTVLARASQGGVAGRRLSNVPDIASVNRVLYIVTAVVAVFFLLEVILGAGKLAGVSAHIRKLELNGSQTTAATPARPATLDMKVVDPALGNRNIFQPAGAQTSESDSAASARASNTYKLVGISEAQDPADTVVMVENTQTKLTYFLQYGQPVEGLELEKIIDDKAVVKIGGDSVELK